MISYLRQIVKPKYPTLNRIEINSEAIFANLKLLQSLQPQAELIPVLKSNAYGHGLKEMCIILNKAKIKMVALDSFPEVQIAYRYFKGKILLIGEMPAAAYSYIKWSRTEICVYNSATLKTLAAYNNQANIHLFINTGMNREGIKDLPAFWQKHLDCWPNLKINGLCSHLLDAENDSHYNEEQGHIFFQALDFLHTKNIQPSYVHLANSAGVFSFKDRRLTAYRPGLSVYGYNPFAVSSDHFQQAEELRPALRLISTVVSLQTLVSQEVVSYNATYTANQETQIAVIPFGYYEGLDRRLSNQANFQIIHNSKNIQAKLAGRVCMNLTCLEVGREEAIAIGDEVILFSDNKEATNSLANLAKLQGTIVYELLVKIQSNIRRVIK
ncbi:MAG: alanine racemase [Patescibacteria group bacterium]|nr:alanine racemase [Patescibacteria group bacterium]